MKNFIKTYFLNLLFVMLIPYFMPEVFQYSIFFIYLFCYSAFESIIDGVISIKSNTDKFLFYFVNVFLNLSIILSFFYITNPFSIPLLAGCSILVPVSILEIFIDWRFFKR